MKVFCALTSALHLGVCVLAIGGECDVIAMHAEVDVVFVKCLDRRRIRRTGHDFIDPTNAFDECDAFVFGEDWRAFVLRDLLIRVYAYDEHVAHELGLTQLIGVTIVHHVEATVRPHAHWLARTAVGLRRHSDVAMVK